MMYPRRIVGLAILSAVLLGVVPVAAQTDDLSRIRAELGEVYAARIGAAVNAGVSDGLPRGLLIDKAIEGVAKGMGPEVVLGAVTAFADELRAAISVVGRDADPVKLEKASDALRRGVDRGLLIRLDRDRPEHFAIIVIALEDLLDVGVPLPLAEDMVRYAVSEGLSGDQMLGLPANVKRLVREGRTPGQAASSVHEGLRSGRGVRPPFDGQPASGFPTRFPRGIPPMF